MAYDRKLIQNKCHLLPSFVVLFSVQLFPNLVMQRVDALEWNVICRLILAVLLDPCSVTESNKT